MARIGESDWPMWIMIRAARRKLCPAGMVARAAHELAFAEGRGPDPATQGDDEMVVRARYTVRDPAANRTITQYVIAFFPRNANGPTIPTRIIASKELTGDHQVTVVGDEVLSAAQGNRAGNHRTIERHVTALRNAVSARCLSSPSNWDRRPAPHLRGCGRDARPPLGQVGNAVFHTTARRTKKETSPSRSGVRRSTLP
jgi:hypothetical protein